MFDETEERQARRVIVLGNTVAINLFPNMDPVGQTVRMNGGTYEVIGVLESKGQSGFQDQDDIVLAPLSTVKRRIAGRRGRGDTVSQISVKAQSEDVLSRLQEDVENTLRQRHRTREGEDDFTVQNLSSISETMAQTTGVFTALLGGISAVSLLVGGIGIMNIMLVSVTERTREIGLRKALGARRKDIMTQFLIEAIMLTALGGLIGALFGATLSWLGSLAISSLIDGWSFIVPFRAVLLAFGVATGVGLVFGLYPARKAAKLDPIEALRYE
jgi:putative ABC transport system permease protein